MKKFITNLSIFTGLTVIIYIIFICVWGSFVPRKLNLNLLYKVGSADFLFTRLNEIDTIGDVDVLFVGSSHAYRGFDPRIFKDAGYKTFTLASSSQTPLQTHILLERHLDKLKPKKVVYEIYPSTFGSDGVESALNLISNDKNDSRSFDMAIGINNIKVYNTLIFGYFTDLTHKNSRRKESLVKGGDRYISGGYVEQVPSEIKKIDDGLQREWDFNPQQFEAFEQSLKLFRDQNIEVVLVYAPITKVRYRSYTNNKAFAEMMRKYGKVYDFNTLMNLNDDSDFADYDHLNQNGVNKFNYALLKIVPLK